MNMSKTILVLDNKGCFKCPIQNCLMWRSESGIVTRLDCALVNNYGKPSVDFIYTDRHPNCPIIESAGSSGAMESVKKLYVEALSERHRLEDFEGKESADNFYTPRVTNILIPIESALLRAEQDRKELEELKKNAKRFAELVRLARTPKYTLTHEESEEWDGLENLFLTGGSK